MQKMEYTIAMNARTDIAAQQARLFKTLMHPTRIAILEALRHNEECVCHLEAQLEVRQAYLSQQLAVLRKAGLIMDRREGLNIFYRITQPMVLELLDTARAMVGDGTTILRTTIPLGACSCPRCTSQ
jgi:DNA-binding transcriptional ArsR family regulator